MLPASIRSTRQKMGIREIRHVDIVAEAGSIRRG